MHRIRSIRTVLSRALRRPWRPSRSDRGAVLLIVAGGMVVLLGMAGLVLDSGRAFLVKAQLSRAVDAGVLAGARAVRTGQGRARKQAIAVAAANGVVRGEQGVSISVSFGSTPEGESTVTVTARRPVRTVLLRLLGRDVVDVASTATAVVPPIDLVFVVDQSTSLRDMGAWIPLKQAARELVTHFDDGMDQMGMVSFGVRATHRHQLSHGFTSDIMNELARMRPIYWTNAAEGLRLARQQITGPAVRDRAVKVVVFFTDGQPTATRTPVGEEDRIMTARDHDPTGQTVGGYYNDPESIPLDREIPADACRSVEFCAEWTEGGPGPHGPVARQIARAQTIAAAARIRADDVYLYTIALGNPKANNPLMRPDLDLLRLIANEHEVASASQPAGRMYFAPSVSELRAVFRQVAEDLVVRLSH